MDTAIVTAMAGVLGSLVGGSASVATTWVTQRALSKRELLRAEIRRRETLYGEFISECSARIIDSFERTLEKPETLLHAYALLNRIRLCASDAVLAQEKPRCASSPNNTSLPIFRSTKCVNSFRNGPLIRSSHSAKRAVSNLNRCAQPCSRAPFCFLQRKLKIKFWARNGQRFAIRGIALRRRTPEWWNLKRTGSASYEPA